MFRLDVLAARFEAMMHRRPKADGVTIEARLDASLHLTGHFVHGSLSLVASRRDAGYPTREVSGSSIALPTGRMGDALRTVSTSRVLDVKLTEVECGAGHGFW
jgi:hypothetical protein